ncbi:MAG: hypothetical protein M1838_003880, partial [Thelocarpon superellum]
MNNCLFTNKFQVDVGSCSDSDVYHWNAAQAIGPYPSGSSSSSSSTSSPSSATATSASSSSASATAADADSTVSSICPDVTSAKRDVGLAAGLGLGIPLLLLAAALAYLWQSERRTRQQLSSQLSSHLSQHPPSMVQAQYPPADGQYAGSTGTSKALYSPLPPQDGQASNTHEMQAEYNPGNEQPSLLGSELDGTQSSRPSFRIG